VRKQKPLSHRLDDQICVIVKNNIDISQYKKLIAFLKQQSVGYNQKKKSKTLTKEEILKFLFEGPYEIRGHYK
jgi:hypothetical protein